MCACATERKRQTTRKCSLEGCTTAAHKRYIKKKPLFVAVRHYSRGLTHKYMYMCILSLHENSYTLRETPYNAKQRNMFVHVRAPNPLCVSHTLRVSRFSFTNHKHLTLSLCTSRGGFSPTLSLHSSHAVLCAFALSFRQLSLLKDVKCAQIGRDPQTHIILFK